MTERTGRSNPVRIVSVDYDGEQGMFCRAYRASDLVEISTLDVPPARSYFPAVLGQLLPDAVKENSRARASGLPLANYKARNPVRAAEHSWSGLFQRTNYGQSNGRARANIYYHR